MLWSLLPTCEKDNEKDRMTNCVRTRKTSSHDYPVFEYLSKFTQNHRFNVVILSIFFHSWNMKIFVSYIFNNESLHAHEIKQCKQYCLFVRGYTCILK